jgi:hypothetical protein
MERTMREQRRINRERPRTDDELVARLRADAPAWRDAVAAGDPGTSGTLHAAPRRGWSLPGRRMSVGLGGALAAAACVAVALVVFRPGDVGVDDAAPVPAPQAVAVESTPVPLPLPAVGLDAWLPPLERHLTLRLSLPATDPDAALAQALESPLREEWVRVTGEVRRAVDFVAGVVPLHAVADPAASGNGA